MIAPPAPPPGVRDFAANPPPSAPMLMPEMIHQMDQDAGMFDPNDILHPGF